MPLFRRRDGDLVRDANALRRIMPFLMRGRNESAVLFEQQLDATQGLAFIRAWNEAHSTQRITFLHLLMYALVQTLHERPRLNRFTMGGFLYQRRGIWLTFAAKKAFNDNAPVVAVKQQFDPQQSFADFVTQTHASVVEGKSDKPSHVDKELSLFLRLPGFVLRWGVRALLTLDAWNLLPHAFIKDDPLYSSAFVTNLGSVKLDAAFHHLFEYGNIPIFVTLGRLGETLAANPDGTVRAQPELVLKWTYDERVEDGFYCAQALETIRQRLEDPQAWLGEQLRLAA